MGALLRGCRNPFRNRLRSAVVVLLRRLAARPRHRGPRDPRELKLPPRRSQ